MARRDRANLIHLIRGSIRYASRKYWDELAGALRPIYQADTPAAAEQALDALEVKLGNRYPAIIRLRRSAWAVGVPPACGGFIPFLDYHVDIRRVICSTNAKSRSMLATAAPPAPAGTTEQAAMKTLYLTTRSLDPKGTGQTRWVVRWSQR